MSARDYTVYFPYGATSAPYSESHPHRGNDRCNKRGEPVLIGNTQIGVVGATGEVYDEYGNKGTDAAAHLHTQEWLGNVGNTRNPKNEFKPGEVIQAATSSDFGNYVTVRCEDNWNVSYCHLDKIDVKVGDKVGDMETSSIELMRILQTEVRGGDEEYVHSGKFDKELHAAYDGSNPNQLALDAWLSTEGANYRNLKKAWSNFFTQYSSTAPLMQATIDNQNKEIADLKAQLALQSDDTKNLNALGAALQWFVKRVGLK